MERWKEEKLGEGQVTGKCMWMHAHTGTSKWLSNLEQMNNRKSNKWRVMDANIV